MHRSSYLASIGVLTLGLFLSLPVLGSSARAQEAPASTAAAETAASCQLPAAVQQAVGDPIAPASCTANCTEGPDVTVNCSGTCTAVDQNCNVNQRGYAQCSGGSRQYCASCSGGGSCTQFFCEPNDWCTTDADCCGIYGGSGFCYFGYCQCPGG